MFNNNLHQLQYFFQDYLISEKEDILPEISNNYGLDARSRLNIYYNAYRARLFEVLQLEYTCLYTLMGEEDFYTLLEKYLDKHPSTSFTVRWFGKNLPDFLATSADYNNKPYLSELAHFEWLQGLGQDAKDMPLLTIEQLKSIPPEAWGDLVFTLHPSVSDYLFHYNIIELYYNLKNKNIIKKQAQPQACLFWRKGINNAFKSMDNIEYTFIKNIQKQLSFGESCENMCNFLPETEVPQRAINILYTLIHNECILELNNNNI